MEVYNKAKTLSDELYFATLHSQITSKYVCGLQFLVILHGRPQGAPCGKVNWGWNHLCRSVEIKYKTHT
jgi:hypothetical protein